MWALGSETVNRIGSMALNNCAFVEVTKASKDIAWGMDALMLGTGVGFGTTSYTDKLKMPSGETEMYVVPDSREGWVESLRKLLESYERGSNPIEFDYGDIRPAGAPIKSFGGISAGYKPLEKLHKRVRGFCNAYAQGETEPSRFITDCYNAVASCVISGNTRRSALIALGSPTDETFIDLKNYEKNPEREEIGWCSNNTVRFTETEHFRTIPELAERIRDNGEPGFLNVLNMQKYGRLGDEMPDKAIGTNPSLRAGTLVYTTEGIVPIETLENKEFTVRNLNGTLSPANCWLSSKSARLYEIKLNNGQSYFATKEHKWPVLITDGLIEKRTTDELCSGDVLIRSTNKGLEFGTEGTFNDGFSIGYNTDEFPEGLWTTASEEYRHGYVQGVLDKRGKIDITNEHYLHVAMGDNAEKFQNLLGFYGVISTIEDGNNVAIRGKASIAQVNHSFDLQYDKSWFGDDPCDIVVVDVVDTGINEPVWDVTVHDETHCFQLAYSFTGNCVTGDTRILTNEGYKRIDSVVNEPVTIWNGNQWSAVTPKITGTNQEILKVTMSDGTSIKCTPYHRFELREGSTREGYVYQKEAKDLQVGDKLEKFDMPVVEFGVPMNTRTAYTQGVYAGDGFIDSDRNLPFIWLYHDKREFQAHLDVVGEPYVNKHKDERRTLVNINPVSMDKDFVPFDWDVQGRLAWFAGLMDTDGTITNDGNIQVSSINLEFLEEIRLMLTTLGVQAKISLMKDAGYKSMPDGRGGMKDYYTQKCYRLMLTRYAANQLHKLGISQYLNRIDISWVKSEKDLRRNPTVVSVNSVDIADFVYCFNEPLNHTGTFEGIVLGQCSEIGLESYELCCLVELIPTRCKTDEEWYEAVELAQIYVQTVSLLPTHSEDTNAVLERNHRLGQSITGITDWFQQEPMDIIITKMRNGYKLARAVNTMLSIEAKVNPSIRISCVKPSGTISQLAGVSSGVHYPMMGRYIRRVRVGDNTPIVPLLKGANIPYEEDAYSDNTLVFEFPIDTGTTKTQRNISMWQKAATVIMLQRHWSDNMPSNTITFDPVTEGDHLEDLIAFTLPNVKSLSLLPDTEEGAYKQMPYEGITKAEYERRNKQINYDVNWSLFGGSDGQDSRFCTNDSCEVSFG